MNTYLQIYSASLNPELLSIPETNYMIIDRSVLAESKEALQTAISLDVLSDAVRARLNVQYVLFPLEGVWRLLDEKISFKKPENIEGRMMIKQPLELTAELLTGIKAEILQGEEHKDLAEYIERAELRLLESHDVIQMLHIGPYSDEPKTFASMHSFARSHGLTRKGEYHREIYLRDVRHASEDAFETIIRMSV